MSSNSSTSRRRSSTQDLADIDVTAAESSSNINRESDNVARLRITNMQLHGRDDDIKLLRSKLRELAKKGDSDEEDAIKNHHIGEMILVSGTSGTGKSALIQKGLGDNAASHGYIFASGKFEDKLHSHGPLSAFSDAMTCLGKYIAVEHNKMGELPSGGLSMSTLIRNKIQNEFDEEDVEQLRRVLPGCAELLGARRSSLIYPSSQADVAAHRGGSDSRLGSLNLLGGKESIARMHYAVRRLLKIVCSHFKGVVLFIDDLQWSDTATLDLLKSILLDGEIPSLLIVGAYREDEVPDHPLAFHIRELQEMNVSITQIKIGNLSVKYAIRLVAEALGMDDDDIKVKSLAETIHKKTEGNPFFMLMFLRSLYDEKLLQYNFGALKWTWDEDAVNSNIVTENVASVLVHKMSRLQEETRRMLMVASCLGSNFRKSAVVGVMKNISRSEMRSAMRSVSSLPAWLPPLPSWGSPSLLSPDLTNSTSAVQSFSCTAEIIRSSSSESLPSSDLTNSSAERSYASSIEEFEGEGLCEVDDEECRFMHDQIQSAAFELISPEQRDSFQGRIGSILLQTLSPEELEASLFEVVGLLNCAASNVTDEKRVELARMNLKAGIKASENAAFDTAKVYFKAGHDVLGSTGWEGDYRTMLDLCSHCANACFVTGDFDSMNELIDEVLSKDIDMKEKYRISEIKVKSLHNIGKFNDSVNTALDFNRQLGLPTQKKKSASTFTIIREFIRVKRLLKNKTAEDIANLPRLDDERYEMWRRMNEHIVSCIIHVEPTMLPLVIFQSVATSLKHGLSSSSPSGFAALGSLLCGPFGKPHEGREMAKAAELILEKPGMRSRATFTVFITQTFCYHWTSPLQDTIAPLLEWYQRGLEIGDTASACWCLNSRSYNLFYVGRALDSIQEELEATIQVMTQLKQDESILQIINLLTAVKKLRGIDVEAGDKILDSMLATAASNDDFSLSSLVNVMKLEVFVFYQEWKEAIELVRKAGNVRQFLTALFTSVRYTFLEALTYLKAAQSASGRKRRQMKKCAHKTIHLIRGWSKNGNVNVVHYLYILDAELAVLSGKNKNAKEGFNAAIATSSRNGFLQDRALAHELASAYFKSQGDEYWVNYHIERSRACYQEWGCVGKVEQLFISESGTTKVEVTEDKADEVTILSDGKRSAGTSALIASRDLLLEGYRTELDNGDVESVSFQISLRCYHSWSAYHPLVDLQAELEASISAIVQLNQRSHERSLQAYLLVVRRLRNLTSKDETSLGFKESLKAVEPTSNVFHAVNMMQFELFVLFQDWEGALPCLTEAPGTRNRYLAMHARGMFLEALVYLKTSSHASSWLARRKKKMKAIKTLRKLNGLVQQGNDDVRHYMHILMAECYVLEKNVSAAENNFKAAISIAELHGFLHDKALAHELACAWYKALGKDDWANFHFERSQKLYTEWGATSKVETEHIYYN